MADAPRCGVCGLQHPFLTVCPYVQEQEIREEYVGTGRQRRTVARIIRTRYFPRPDIAEALIPSLEEAEEPRGADEVPAPSAVEAGDAG